MCTQVYRRSNKIVRSPLALARLVSITQDPIAVTGNRRGVFVVPVTPGLDLADGYSKAVTGRELEFYESCCRAGLIWQEHIHHVHCVVVLRRRSQRVHDTCNRDGGVEREIDAARCVAEHKRLGAAHLGRPPELEPDFDPHAPRGGPVLKCGGGPPDLIVGEWTSRVPERKAVGEMARGGRRCWLHGVPGIERQPL